MERDGVVRHVWGSELLRSDSDFDRRHSGQLWPLWNGLDVTHQGRGTSWCPRPSYGAVDNPPSRRA